ncbi:hypothetical protein IE077_000703 [Cardiosporidium cionae]|uniref:Cation-transporting P-type ATPase C-terminal domain-containing protein n=1 Tax=Cardiosporidium cionae TaxID=476202 RepID=A0ABQ7J3M3_9APIC|nr:hypothetical protein IE077_000703 [Cardiosporidium cionae]|eukprot:KAF8817702.1 hypothetical protein IE077_000703 [Cardiosporidium cionae]
MIASTLQASTLSLTVLVLIEMLNAFNSLSDTHSLLQTHPFVNPYLLLAVAASLLVHCFVLYTPFLGSVFGVVPLSATDWLLVSIWSFPVVIIDEVLKAIGRYRSAVTSTLNKAHKLIHRHPIEMRTMKYE